MKKVYTGSILSIVALLIIFLGCGGGSSGSSNSISGIIKSAQYSVDSGKIVQVSDDVVIESNSSIVIDGDIIALGDKGQNITLKAVDDINISGNIISGSANGAKRNGGSITLISEKGNINIVSGSHLQAGDGKSGDVFSTKASKLRTTTDYSGAIGGSVILKAENGMVSIPEKEGIITLGNGGNGADIEVHGTALLTTYIDEINNNGGDSGVLNIDAISIDGITITKEILSEDVVYEGNSSIILMPKGTVLIKSELAVENQIIGGLGGNGGSCVVGLDENNNSTWPSTRKSLLRVSSDKTEKAFGGKGGDGFFGGGDGERAMVKGSDGVTDGEDGQAALAAGGNGGRGCVVIFGGCFGSSNAKEGKSGSSFAVGGDGASGANPSGDGGAGGIATAYSVYTSSLSEATAIGGKGGKGGDACPTKDNIGGAGGSGGYALTVLGLWMPTESIPLVISKKLVKNTTIYSILEANDLFEIQKVYPGNGGDGGSAVLTAGAGGNWGYGCRENFSHDLCIRSESGKLGNICPVASSSSEASSSSISSSSQASSSAPSGCTCETATLSYMSSEWGDCKEVSGCHSTLESLGSPELVEGENYTETYGNGSGCSFVVQSCP